MSFVYDGAEMQQCLEWNTSQMELYIAEWQ